MNGLTERQLDAYGRPLVENRNQISDSATGQMIVEPVWTNTWTYDDDGRLARFHADSVDNAGDRTIAYRYRCE